MAQMLFPNPLDIREPVGTIHFTFLSRFPIRKMDTTPVSLLQKMRLPANGDSWDQFVYIYAPFIDRWAIGMGVLEADRADLVQEVLLALLRALPAFEYDAGRSFRSWLHTIAANKWRDFCRKRVPSPLSDGDGRWAALAADPVAEFDEAEYGRLVTARVLELIKAEFQPATWRAFWLTVVDELPAETVAEQLQITPNAVYLARGRILRRLRTELKGLLD